MRSIIVRYTVKPGMAEENERLIAAVFAELDATNPPGLRYAVFRVKNGLGFVHVASIDTPDGTNPLLSLESFKRFSSTVKDRADEPPTTTEVTRLASYAP